MYRFDQAIFSSVEVFLDVSKDIKTSTHQEHMVTIVCKMSLYFLTSFLCHFLHNFPQQSYVCLKMQNTSSRFSFCSFRFSTYFKKQSNNNVLNIHIWPTSHKNIRTCQWGLHAMLVNILNEKIHNGPFTRPCLPWLPPPPPPTPSKKIVINNFLEPNFLTRSAEALCCVQQ